MPCQMSFPSWQSYPPPFQCSLLKQSFLPAGAGRFAMRAACPQWAFRFLCEDIHGWNSPPLLICLLVLEFPRRHLNCEAFVCGQCRVWVGCLVTQIRETTGHGSWMFIDLVSIDFQVSGRGLCCLACVLEDYIRKRPMGQTFFPSGKSPSAMLGNTISRARQPESEFQSHQPPYWGRVMEKVSRWQWVNSSFSVHFIFLIFNMRMTVTFS